MVVILQRAWYGPDGRVRPDPDGVTIRDDLMSILPSDAVVVSPPSIVKKRIAQLKKEGRAVPEAMEAAPAAD